MAPKKKVKKADDKAQDGATAIKTAESVITKQFGEGALVFLSDYEEKELEVIPTGSISLDSALGVGGLTKRKMVEVFGVPGCGKAQPMDSRVLTPRGWEPMGRLCEGDLISTPDGGSGVVCGVFPQGEKDVYKVIFSDGSSAESCLEHLWCVQTKRNQSDDVYQVLSLSEIIESGINKSGRLLYSIPSISPIEFTQDSESDVLLLDSYVLGLLLGDGSFRNKSIGFTTADEELRDAVSSYVSQEDCLLRHVGGYDYRIVKTCGRGKSDTTFVRKAVERFGLFNKKSEDKFVPERYLFSSIKDRVALLQGLMDTDGSCSKEGHSEFSTTSPRMANQVVHLVRSLGGKASISSRFTRYTYNGESKKGKKSFRVNIRMPDSICPFRLKRKSDRVQIRHMDYTRRWIKDVRFSRKTECQCIMVDSPDQLYITNDFVVTHNTTIAISTAVQAQKMNENEKVIFVDVEKSFSKELALSMGLDEKRTVILSLPTAEQNLAAAEILIKTGEFGMCIIDSVAALTPEVEFQASIEDQQMGLHARLMSKMCRKIKPVIYDTNTMLFLINQTRSKIGGYGNPETTTGGAAIPFYSDIRIKVSGGTSKAERIKAGDKEGEVVGHKMKFAVVKNKLSAPYKEGSVDLIYGAGFDNLGEMVDVGGEVGLIEQKGAWLMYDEVKFQGRARFREALIADPALYESLWADIKRILYR